MGAPKRVGSSSGKSEASTGLIVLSALDTSGLADNLFETLAPFTLSILDVEQITIGSRLILCLQISLNPAHASAIEADLAECALRIDADIAVVFSDDVAESRDPDAEFLLVTILGEPITPATLAHVTQALSKAGAHIGRITRGSSPTLSLQLHVSRSSLTILRPIFSALSHEQNLEISIQSAQFQNARKMIVLDVDSTLIEQEVIELLARRAGMEDEVRRVTESAMKGEIDFEASLIARVSLLKGLPESVIEEVRAEISLTPGAETLIRTLQDLGHCVGLVTGGFREVLAPLIQELKITHFAANSLEIVDGHLTGRTSGVIIDRAGKAKTLKDFATTEGIPLEHTIAIGDGANDLDMIEMAGLGIAFNAKPAVRAQSDSSITKKDLARVLDLLGIPRKR